MAERLTAEVASFQLQTGGSMANDERVALLRQGVAPMATPLLLKRASASRPSGE